MKGIIKYHGHLCVMLLCAAVFFGCRCSPSKPTPDPLAGWTYKPLPGWELPPYGHNTNQLDKTITDDYQAFISDHHLMLFGAVQGYFENTVGEHAVQFIAFPPGENATWTYVLIYDKTNKRIKVIKYNHVHYMS